MWRGIRARDDVRFHDHEFSENAALRAEYSAHAGQQQLRPCGKYLWSAEPSPAAVLQHEFGAFGLLMNYDLYEEPMANICLVGGFPLFHLWKAVSTAFCRVINLHHN